MARGLIDYLMTMLNKGAGDEDPPSSDLAEIVQASILPVDGIGSFDGVDLSPRFKSLYCIDCGGGRFRLNAKALGLKDRIEINKEGKLYLKNVKGKQS